VLVAIFTSAGTVARRAGSLGHLAATTVTLGGLEALFGVKQLLCGGEGELGAANGAGEHTLGVHPGNHAFA
jgi:hypothetical protein